MDDIVLDRSALDRLIATYEDVRSRRGLGTALHRVTPGQRLDALHVCLAVAAAGRAPGTGTRAFWLSHLAPVLAETRESAAALKEALDLAFPREAPVHWWTGFAAETRRSIRQFGWIASPAMAGVAALALVVAVLILLYPALNQSAPSDVPPGIDPGPFSRVANDWQSEVRGGSALARVYGETLTAAVATLREHQGTASPRTLARTFAAAFPQAGAPAHLLVEMIGRFPLAPDQPIPPTPEGGLAVRHYALVIAERLAPGSVDDMAILLGNDTAVAAPGVASLLENFQSGKWGSVQEVPAADPTVRNGFRYLPFLIVLLGSVWALRAPNRLPPAAAVAHAREEVVALRDARRAGAGSWAEARVVQTGTAGLPPLPSAGRVARALIGFREPQPGNRLDDARSVRATLQSAGDFVTVMRPRSRAVEFVFLIRRRHRHDHERARALRLVNALSNAGLALTAYDYGPDPRFLTATGRVGAGDSRSATTLDLRGLRERHFGAVLILVTDGDEILDPLTLCPLGFVERELAAWPRRMILTPTPTAAWGDREYRLAAALDAPIGRATLTGLADLALVFDLDSPEAKARRPLTEARQLAAWGDRVARWRTLMTAMLAEDPLPVPPPILTVDDIALVSDCAPPPQMVDAVIFALRLWLGYGYSWFVAAVVHPQLRFDVTLWLGANLTRKAAPPNLRSQALGIADWSISHLSSGRFVEIPLFSEDLLDRLCVLPWFRQGRIPIWLRKAAFERAREQEKAAARAVIERLLVRTAPSDASGAVSLPVWLADWRGQKLAADDTMVGFRSEIPLVQEISAGKSTALFHRRWVALVLARFAVLVVWAAVAFSLVPPSDAPQSNGAWLPLAAFVATTLALCLVLAFPPVRALPGALYWRLGRRAVPPTRAKTEEALP